MKTSWFGRGLYGATGALALALVLTNMPVSAAHVARTPRWLVVDAKSHAVTLIIIAGYNGANNGFNFDGYGNGKMVIKVPAGYRINVVFSNKGNFPHSAVFTPFAKKDKQDGYPLAFRGSSSPDPTSGIQQGTVEHFSFVANKAGTYALVCGVPGHESAGMWDVLKVTHGGKPTLTTS